MSISNTSDKKSPIASLFWASLAKFKKKPVLEEVFDASYAQWVIDNEKEAFKLLPIDRQHTKRSLDECASLYVKGWSETISDLKELMIRSSPTSDKRYRVHSVSYKQPKGKGRMLAREKGALATMQREIRQLIAHPNLKDYDFKNAHPVILQ